MKAILFDQPGDPDVLYLGETDDPTPGPNELLVRVHATGVNRAETLQRRGSYTPPPGASPILGLELAGEVVQAAGTWQQGDRVMAVVTGGGYAELATVPADTALHIPDGFSYSEAAAIPEAFLTAYLNLFILGALQQGERVLIHAGGSGVGTAAIQLARAAGAQVFTTAGTEAKRELARSLGAAVAIDYKTESFADRVAQETNDEGVNLVLDFIGAPYWNDNTTVLARNGRLVLIGFLGGAEGELNIGAIMRKTLTVCGTTLRGTPLATKIELAAAFSEFALPRFESGELRPIIDTTLPLAETAQAHTMMEANQNAGKIVLEM